MYDVCIIGSGAGASPVAYELSKSGKKVIVLEKGPLYNKDDFSKDEIAYVRRNVTKSDLRDEYHIIERFNGKEWKAVPTSKSWVDMWSGNIVGGSSTFMSGLFHRMHPADFKLKSNFTEIKDANIEDWPISYDDLAAYYDKVEQIIGVSGRETLHKYLEPRKNSNFPYSATIEHPIGKYFDKSCQKIGLRPMITPRAILTKVKGERKACYYSNFCGNYGCSSGAKGSAKQALLDLALEGGNLTIIADAFVKRLLSNKHQVTKAIYVDKNGKDQVIKAKVFIVAAKAIETSRLLLNSASDSFPNGLSNNSNQVGKNLLFSSGAIVGGDFIANANILQEELMTKGPFVNRSIVDLYFLDSKIKGGLMMVLLEQDNPILKAKRVADSGDKLIWGEELYHKIYDKFNNQRRLNIEVMNDWLPNDDCFVTIDSTHKDKFDTNVAKIRINSHPHNKKILKRLIKTAQKIHKKMGAENIKTHISDLPSPILQAGGCRFGNDPKKSVLNKYCQSHEVNNLFITDGSFMPTGGSTPYTFTIYANSFRVADYIVKNWKSVSQ